MFFSNLTIRNVLSSTIFSIRIIFLLFGFCIFFILLNFTRNPVPLTSIIWAFSPEYFNDFRETSQEDPKLIYYLKHYLIQPPSVKAYNLTKNQKWTIPQQGYLASYFKNKENGTFIEVGGYDGESASVTLHEEFKKGWTGLLIEPNPKLFEIITYRNRKARTIKCCLSDFKSPKLLFFRLSGAQSEVITKPKANDTSVILTWCYPLYSLMVATNMANLDLLSIDLQGFELKVLKTLPWEKVNIKTILIEYILVPEGRNGVMNYLLKKNYKFVKDFDGYDLLFVKNNSS